MKKIIRIYPLLITAAIFFSICAPALAGSKSEIYKNWQGLAIKAYDPVAYHTEGKPMKGTRNYEYEWKGAKWRFAKQSHLDLFKSGLPFLLGVRVRVGVEQRKVCDALRRLAPDFESKNAAHRKPGQRKRARRGLKEVSCHTLEIIVARRVCDDRMYVK